MAVNVSYFGYLVREPANGKNWLVDLRPFVRAFADSKDHKRKAQLTHNGEQLFFLPLQGNVYLFVQARDREIIKAIQKQKLSVKDIHTALQAGESVGFASYVHFGKHWLGIGCQVLSPRITALASFMNQVFALCGTTLQFVPRALMQSLPKSAVASLQEVSAITIEMSIENGIAKDLYNAIMSRKTSVSDDIASLEIVLRRRRKGKRSMGRELQALVANIPEQGLESFEVRAKMQAGEHMTDLYIVGQGGIRDTIESKTELFIVDNMVACAEANALRKEKVKELREDARCETAQSAGALGLAWESGGNRGRDLD